jgi:phosphatidylglycerophosphate synthase
MKFKDYLIEYKKNEHPASTIFHKYISKNLAKILVYFSLKLGITPNKLSVFSTLCLLLSGYSLIKLDLFWVFILLTQISYALDCSDGVVARITNHKSIFGKFLDIALDRINMLIFYSSIILYYLDTNSFNINNLWTIIIGFILYYLYSLLAMIRGLVYSTKRGQGAKQSNILIRINYEFIDSGIYMFLIGIFLYFNILHILSFYYIGISLLFIFGVFYRSYKDRR